MNWWSEDKNLIDNHVAHQHFISMKPTENSMNAFSIMTFPPDRAVRCIISHDYH